MSTTCEKGTTSCASAGVSGVEDAPRARALLASGASGLPDGHAAHAGDGEGLPAALEEFELGTAECAGRGGTANEAGREGTGVARGSGAQDGQNAALGSKSYGGRGGARPTRSWTIEQRLQHRIACKSKGKLSLGQKLDIITQHQSRDPVTRKTQAQLAQIYGKSRSAISKILRPENIAKLQSISDTGVRKGVKRYSHVLPQLELEKRIHTMIVEKTGGGSHLSSGRRAEVMAFAQEVALTAGITDFRPTYGWYARFLKRHGLVETFDGVEKAATSPGDGYDDMQEEEEEVDSEEEDMSEDDDQGNTARTLGNAMCGSTGVSAFNAFSRPPTLHDAPAPMCQTANARTVEHPSAAFAHEAAAMRPRDMWAAAAAAAASKNFKDAAGTAPQATVRGPLETWLWGTAQRDDALKVGMQSIENEYQRNLQRAHESYQREIQLQEQAYNAAAATSAILSLHKLAAANNMPVSLDLLGIDPSALAGLGILPAEPFSSFCTEEVRAPQGSSAPRYGGLGWSSSDLPQSKLAKGATLLGLASAGDQASHLPVPPQDGRHGNARDMGMAIKLPPLSESLSRLNKTF